MDEPLVPTQDIEETIEALIQRVEVAHAANRYPSVAIAEMGLIPVLRMTRVGEIVQVVPLNRQGVIYAAPEAVMAVVDGHYDYLTAESLQDDTAP